jgi:mannose-6-phosphate isomerase-like protein (cupin superfamily)
MQINVDSTKRPWGEFLLLTQDNQSWVKILTIEPLQRISLQSHNHRDEYWIVISGEGLVTLQDEKSYVSKGNGIEIPIETVHRIQNISKTEKLIVLELALGDCKEEDIIRYEDDWNRITQ